METVKRLFISLIVLLGCSAGAWAIEQDADGYYLIGSVQDWKDFAALVQTTPTANAKMTADVDLGDDQTTIGSPRNGGNLWYQGTFDGDGHTLTIAYNNTSGEVFTTPFTLIQGATIKNLHIDGTVNTVYAYGGSVASIGRGSNTLKNIWNSVTSVCTMGGWDQMGAFFGVLESGSSMDVSDCLFTGSMSHPGGYSGYFSGGYGPGPHVSNCLVLGEFTGDYGFNGTFTNCYLKHASTTGVTIPTDEQLADGTIATALGDGWAQDPLTHQPVPKIFTTVQDEDGYYLIGSVQDWKRFADIVNSGTNPAANAKMVRDVEISTTIGVREDKPFSGTFDGNGHILTANITSTATGINGNDVGVAPFHFIKNATIKNLKVDGIINSSSIHSSGLVGVAYGTNLVVGCVVSAKIKTSAQYVGGIIAHGYDSNTTVKDCLFNGIIEGGNRIGVIWAHNHGGTGNIINCLENGSYTNSSYVLPIYRSEGGTINCSNNYYITGNDSKNNKVTDVQLADGTTAAALQAGRSEEIWVQDPVLGIPMLKIFANIQDEDGYYLIGSVQDWKRFADIVKTTPTANAKMTADVDLGDDQTMVGSYHVRYKGTFDGQGHTLTFKYNTAGMSFEPEQRAFSLDFLGAAPFRDIEGATIRNLHTAGSVTAEKIGASGLVGWTYGTNTIENCWSDVDIVSSNNTADTFAGFVAFQYGTQLNITDCVYTGKIQSASNISHAGFVAFQRYGKTSLNNCLLLLDKGSDVNTTPYQNLMYYTFVRNHSDNYLTNTINNCYYLTPFGVAQGTQTTDGEISDGTTAAALQADRSEEIWVQDPELGIPMLKIFANEETEQPSEALNGIFTINASGEKVSFAKGNLQKIGSTYQFAEHQYDYFGTNQSDTHRDMYAFLAYSNPDNGESWSMLSRDEWEYLFATRTVTNTLSDGARYTMATIGDTYKGLIIFPDYYTHPEGTGFTSGVFNSNSNYTAEVSLEGWALMEAAGCVFLPAAGYCSLGSTWVGVGEYVCYMSTTPDGSNNYYDPYFTPNSVKLYESSSKRTWSSIRLVLRLQPLTYTVPASGVGTFSSDVNIHLPEGLNAHYCKTYYEERSAISVVNISSGVVPANTGVLLSGTPGETFNLYPTPETADGLDGNALVAVTKPVHISPTKGDYTNFMMKGGKFVKIADESYTVKMPANRAYLPLLTEAISGSNAKEIMLYWDDEEATGVERMRNVENEIMRNGNIYNLNGQKLSAPQKGINIINGRKVIVK